MCNKDPQQAFQLLEPGHGCGRKEAGSSARDLSKQQLAAFSRVKLFFPPIKNLGDAILKELQWHIQTLLSGL